MNNRKNMNLTVSANLDQNKITFSAHEQEIFKAVKDFTAKIDAVCWSFMSDDQIKALISQAEEELQKRAELDNRLI